MRDSFDTAQICVNGHVITTGYFDFPQYRKDFCDRCGGGTITACPACDAQLQGHNRGDYFALENPPTFCHSCGKPFPWTESKVQSIVELLTEEGSLTPDAVQTLKENVWDIVREVPRSAVAASRIKRVLASVSMEIGNAARELVREVATDAAKGIILPRK